jgi:hypothetical protein
MKNLIVVAFGAVGWLGMEASSPAQVAVGPGFVQAPYVRVEWNHGGIHVQAPFVDFHTGPWCCYDAVVKPSAPVERPTASPPTVAEQLFSAGRDLNRELERFDTAATWQHYFGLSGGEPLASLPVEHLAGKYMYPSSSTADVAGLQRHFDTVRWDERYRMIASLPSFQRTYRLLIDFQNQPKSPASRTVEELPVPNDATIRDDRPQPRE